jgi:hypothetical protein
VADNGATPRTFDDDLEALGFVAETRTRRGGTVWVLPFNSFLTFTLHDYRDSVVLTWTYALGEFAHARGWQVGSGEASMNELYPVRDVRLSTDIGAVEAEITRVLTTLRLDLGDPSL